MMEQIHRLRRKFDADRTVLFGLANRIWSLCTGPITAILIATYFSAELQGYYYTFSTILALQVFVELGLGTVIVQFASHEWSKLDLCRNGRIVGDAEALSRLASIARFAVRWYSIGASVVAVGLGIGGCFFFHLSRGVGIDWQLPWLTLCIIAGSAICLVPIWSLLEGCNQLAHVYAFRCVQSVITSFCIWGAIIAGLGLWTATISALVGLVCASAFLLLRYRRFVQGLLMMPHLGPKIVWQTDLLPMQWRIATGWIAGYFIFSFFVPVLFKFHGPKVAGQMGMTWTVISAVGAISAAWLSPQAPRFGMLIAQRRFEELDLQFWRTTKIVVGITGCAAFGVWLLIVVLNKLPSQPAERFAARLLPPLPTGLFLAGQFLSLATTPFSTYLRAHKKEPLMLLSIVYAILVGSSNLILGRNYSATGMAVGYLLINASLVPAVVMIWQSCRNKWHGAAISP